MHAVSSLRLDELLCAPAGSLVPYLPDNLLDEVSTDILKELQKSGAHSEATRVLIQALGAIGYAAQVVHKFSSLQILLNGELEPAASIGFSTVASALCVPRRAAGWRFGRHLDIAVPLVVEKWSAAGEGDDELKDLCLQALEAFVLRSPLDSKRHLDAILDIAQRSLSYDPNYADDMEQDTEEEEEEEEAYVPLETEPLSVLLILICSEEISPGCFKF